MSLGRLLSSGKSLIGLSSASRYQLRTGSLPKFESQKNPFAKPSAEQADTQGLSPAEMAATHLKKTQLLPLLPPTPEVPGESFQPPKPNPSETRAKPPTSTPQETKPSVPSPALNRLAASKRSEGGAADIPVRSNSSDPAANSTSSAGTTPPSPVGRERAGVRVSDSEKSQPPAIVTNWLKKLNPLVWFGDRKPTESKPVPRFNKNPVQGELSLENIKVMRNDLSDADVEVVPKKTLPMQDIPLPSASAAAAAIPELPPATSAWEYLGERLLRNH